MQVGHSLGGALAELDTLFMRLNLPAGTTVRGVTFGKPRVGNPAWATYFDFQIANFTRVNNKRDVVPTVPGRRLGFQHPHQEIHIQEDGRVVACPGESSDHFLRAPQDRADFLLAHYYQAMMTAQIFNAVT